MSELDLWADHKKDLPEEWHETFDALVGAGSSPSGVKAAIEYVTTEKNQEEVAEEFGTSMVTVRNQYPAVIALGPVDEVTPAAESRWRIIDMVEALSQHLGWEEGTHYSVSQAHEGATRQVSLNKAGWQSIMDAIRGDDDE